jgi:hypothetical protein
MDFVRKFLAVVSACGLAASTVVYLGSYVGLSMDSLAQRAIILHVGVFLLLLPMFALEWRGLNERTFFWKGFAETMPKWVVPAINVIGLFCMAHFVVFLVQSRMASPEIINGQYVLNNHGQIVRVLTRYEYLRLKGAELRLFASGWMFFYFVPTMYWWFPRNTANQHEGRAIGV